MKCSFCKNFVFSNPYILHLKYEHAVNSRFECTVDKCKRLFHNVNIFKKHLLKIHQIYYCRTTRQVTSSKSVLINCSKTSQYAKDKKMDIPMPHSLTFQKILRLTITDFSLNQKIEFLQIFWN